MEEHPLMLFIQCKNVSNGATTWLTVDTNLFEPIVQYGTHVFLGKHMTSIRNQMHCDIHQFTEFGHID